MTKGYAEAGGMRSRLAGGRGPQRFLLIAVCLVMVVLGLNYWRLMAVNRELTDRLRAFEEQLQNAHDKLASVERRWRVDRDDLRKASLERQALQDAVAEKESKLQEMTDALDEQRDSLKRQTNEIRQQNEQEQDSRVLKLQEQLRGAEEKLASARQQLNNCTSLGCDGRVKLLQFELETCRFAQQHGGNAGIHRGPAGDKLMVGRNSLSQLFESGGMAGFQKSPLKAPQKDPPAVIQSPTTQNGKVAAPASLPHPALAEPAVAAAGAVAEDAPAEMAPVDVQVVQEPSKTSQAPPEIAPVEGDVLPDENDKAVDKPGGAEEGVGAADGDPAAKAGEEPAEDPAAAEDAAAGEDAPAEQAPAEDGAGLLSRREDGKPPETQLQGGADQLDLAYPNQSKEALEPAEGAAGAEGEQAPPPPPRTADAKEAALISGLQELAEPARSADGDVAAGAVPAAAALEPRLDDFEDVPAAGVAQ